MPVEANSVAVASYCHQPEALKYPRIFFISCQYSIEKRQGLREGVVDEDDDANRQAEACP